MTRFFVNNSAVNDRFEIGSHGDFCKIMHRMMHDFMTFDYLQCVRF